MREAAIIGFALIVILYFFIFGADFFNAIGYAIATILAVQFVMLGLKYQDSHTPSNQPPPCQRQQQKKQNNNTSVNCGCPPPPCKNQDKNANR
jgi:hypothetical protein